MALVVQKYGGSSLANVDLIKSVAKRIARTHTNNSQVVVVVSAMGDTTDELIAISHDISEQPDARELDFLLSTGELVSCTLMAMALRSIGHNAISLSGAQAGIKTDTSYGRAKIAGVDPKRILDELRRNNIVIVAGFQGVTDDLDITTLGRGGSDTTAVAIAAGISADRCEIYTDVEGIYTADPRIVPNARQIDEIGFEEMLELASYGAKMNPRSIELGMVYNIPIIVASSFIDAPGTTIHKLEVDDMDMRVGERDRVIGIPTEKKVAKITILGVVDRPGIAANIFEPLAESGISVDVIVQNSSVDGTTDLTFTVSRADVPRAEEILQSLASEIRSRSVVTDRELAKVSVVGAGIQGRPGYAAKMFRTLAEANVNIEMITTSDIRITCIVREAQVEEAARVLHDAFQLENKD